MTHVCTSLYVIRIHFQTVSYQEGQGLAEEIHAQAFYEVSASRNTNIEESMNDVALRAAICAEILPSAALNSGNAIVSLRQTVLHW
jgi:hypothetical protein